MDNESQSQVEHFAALKSKYQATKYEDSSPSTLLYLILRKFDLGIELTEFEFNWLLEHELFETLETIEQEKRHREEEISNLKTEFEQFLYKCIWFDKAIKRGAKPEEVDYEIKRVVRDTKDENKSREVVEYLLNKDPKRYTWAKSYLKKSNSKG
jgi:hypothetical protein